MAKVISFDNTCAWWSWGCGQGYYDASASSYTLALAAGSAMLPAVPVVGDAVIGGSWLSPGSYPVYGRLYFYITTALAATSISLTWEYVSKSSTVGTPTWTAMTNVVDNTDSLRRLSNAVGAKVFTGTGLDDATSGGSYTSFYGVSGNGEQDNFRVEIDGTSPDTFKWSNDGGSTWEATTVAITGSAQTLENGVTITFAATTGHTSGDRWDFTANPYVLSVYWDMPTDMTRIGEGSTGCDYYAVPVRARVTAIDTITAIPVGKTFKSMWTINCNGETSSDKITFKDIYDYVIGTVGRTDLVYKTTGSDAHYVFNVSLAQIGYFEDSNCSAEFHGGMSWDDICTLTRVQLINRQSYADIYLYTDGVWTDVMLTDPDGFQRGMSFAGTGTYIRMMNYIAALCHIPSGITWNQSSILHPTGWFASSVGVYIDFNGTSIGKSSTYWDNNRMWSYTKNATITSAVISLIAIGTPPIDWIFENVTMGRTQWVSNDATLRLLECWSLYLKVQDSAGDAISGATVTFSDVNAARREIHARITTNAASGQKVVVLDSTSRLTAGDSIKLSAFSQNEETAEIDTVDSGTQITVTSNLTRTHYVGWWVHNNTTQSLTTDSNGDINYQSPIYMITPSSTTNPAPRTACGPYTITITKAGYQTHTSTIDVSEKRDMQITLEPSYIQIDQEGRLTP